MQTARALAGDLFGVVIHGLRLVAAHWPVLAVIYLLGAAGRNGILWAAVALSAHHPTLAWFLMPLAPLSSLTAFILMLDVAASSLASVEPTTTGRNSKLTLLASALVPFLTVYAAQGYLKEDRKVFFNHAVYDAIFGSAGTFYGRTSHAVDRLIFAQGWVLASIVIVAFALRFLLSRFDLPTKHASLGGVAGYVEVLWMLILASQLTHYKDRMWAWFLDRRFVAAIHHGWDVVVSALGPIGHPLQVAASAIGTFVDHSDEIVLIPIAWLTVGAVALGGTLPEREPKPGRWDPYTRRVPAKVRSLGSDLTASLTDRFRGLIDGFRVLAIGGLAPMLMFCLAFVLSRAVGDGFGELWRLVVGPQPHNTGLAFAGWREMLATGVSTVILIGLLGAAIDRILSGRAQPRLTAERSMST